MPSRVYLLRHAESANPNVFHGAESDIGLGERGRRQAEAIARVLADHRPGALVSSAMRRARETAEPIARACGLTLETEAELHERRVGILSGTSYQHSEVWPETLNRWMAGDVDYASAGAESFRQIRDRVVPSWERITARHAERDLVVVAHGVVCKVLLVSVLPEFTLADWAKLGPIRNVAITELERHNRVWKSVRINDVPRCVQELEP